MSRFAWLVTLCALTLTAIPVLAGDPKAAKKADPTADLLATLRQPTKIGAFESSLADLCQFLKKKHGVTVLINDEAFKVFGLPIATELMVKIPETDTLSLAAVLNHALGQKQTTFLVRKGYLEVMPIVAAGVETKNLAPNAGEASSHALREPLVSIILKEKPLNEAVAELAEEFELNVIVSPQAGDAKTGFVTARLLNTPADKALDLLAVQCDLRVVRKGNAFLLTSKEHANELFNEKLDKERQKIEVEKLREAPAKPPVPPEKADK